MKVSVVKIVLFVTIAVFFSVHTSYALLGNTAGKAARETIEYTAKKFGIELSKDAGREFTEKAVQFIAKHGDDGARLLKSAGPEIIELTAKHGDDMVRMCASHSDDAISFLMKNADGALPLWRQFGKEGTEMMLKHPGLGEQAVKEFGSGGLAVANKLSSESLNKALVLSSKATTQAEKTALFDAIMKRGDDVIEFLWKHKWKIGAGATVYALLKDFNVSGPVPGGGKVESRGPQNLPQRMVSSAWDKMLDEYPWVTLVVIGFIILWLYPLLKWIFKIPGKVINLFSKKDKTPPARQAKREIAD